MIYLLLNDGRIPPAGKNSLAHQEVRGCLFDLKVNKADIVASLNPPSLCQSCRTRLVNVQTPPNFFASLDKDLGNICQALFYRMSRWVQSHPIISLSITAALAVFLNILANSIYDKLKSVKPWIG